MSDVDDYTAAVVAAAVAARMLAQHDISGLLRAIEQADAIGPIMDPTLWMEKRDAMAEDAAMLRAAMPLWERGKAMEQNGEDVSATIRPEGQR